MERVAPDGGPELSFEVDTTQPGGATVTIRGELDIANIDELEAAVAPVIEFHPDRLVVDVGELRFADSSAIAMWVRWAASVGEVVLRGVPPLLRQIITTMGLDERFRLD